MITIKTRLLETKEQLTISHNLAKVVFENRAGEETPRNPITKIGQRIAGVAMTFVVLNNLKPKNRGHL